MFYGYEALFPVQCSLQQATTRILDLIDEKKYLKLIQANYNGNQKLVIDVKPDGYRNAFVPIVTIKINSHENGCEIGAVFEFKKMVKIFLLGFNLYLLISAIAITYYNVAVATEFQRIDFGQILIPLGMSFFSWIMSLVGLKRSSKRILSILYACIEDGDSRKTPIKMKNIKRENKGISKK